VNDREPIGFRIRPDEGGGHEILTSELAVAHDLYGVYVLLNGRPVLNIHEDEADLLVKVLPSHAAQVRKLRAGGGTTE
jgi:hypothetical protein